MAQQNKDTTFSGINFSNAKRIVEYEFSEHLMFIDRDIKTQTYIVHITNKINRTVVDKFKKYWKEKFIVKVYELKYEL